MGSVVGAGDRRSTTFAPLSRFPRSVYIHVPFCRHRCGYCNFALVANRDDLIRRYLSAIQKEIAWLDRTYEIDTLFLGGGTPSHLTSKDFEFLFQGISDWFQLTADAEVTVECNPSDITDERVRMFSYCGVNRISLGVQSFRDQKLRLLERDHDAAAVDKAVEAIRRRIENVSLDLIFATPGETLQQWKTDLDHALALSPSHLSTYELTFEKGTRFWNRRHHGQLASASEDLCAAMYEHTMDRLVLAGWEHYEVSSFAQTGYRCLHNQQYWNGNPYFAFGPGASRYVDGIRETNHASTSHYLKQVEAGKSPVADRERLPAGRSAAERLAIGLRRIDGVETAEFTAACGLAVDDVLGSLKRTLIDHGLAEETMTHFRLTRQGIMMCDRISVEIVGRLNKE